MIVTRDTVDKVLNELKECKLLSFDTETTGLRPYHSDYAFCATIASSDKEYFFNFDDKYASDSLDPQVLLPLLNDPEKNWVMCNAKFDMAMMARHNLLFRGKVAELQAAYRLLNNEDMDISLSNIAHIMGFEKSGVVDKYISENKLYTTIDLPHVKRKRKDLHFNLVPVAVLSPYALRDARITYDSFMRILSKFSEMDKTAGNTRPSCHKAFSQELTLTKVLFHMEQAGVLIDRQYCNDAAKYYREKLALIEDTFFELTGKKFAKAPTLFKEIFEGEKFEFTDKENPRFDKKSVAKFKHPAAKLVIDHSAATKQVEYFNGFLYHADRNDILHTRFNQAGTTTGRLSSSEPNMQNLTKADKYESSHTEPTVREAIVSRPGYFFAMLDYEQIEYRVMLDMARAHGLIQQVISGLDVHEATAKLAGISRQQAKTVNFLTLYGGGIAKLAGDLNCSQEEARAIQNSIFRAAPEIKDFIKGVSNTAQRRGYVFNYMGRRYNFIDSRTSYRAPNHLVQGTSSEILKEAMIKCTHFLNEGKYRSCLVLSIHDELVFEIFIGEEHIIPKLKEIMENAYPSKRLPMAVDIEVGFNLADKHPFFDLAFLLYGKEVGDGIQGEGLKEASHTSELMGMQDSTSI